MLTKSLYEISAEYRELFDRLEELATNEDTTPEEMDQLIEQLSLNEGDLKDKAQAYAVVLRQKQAQADFIDGEIKRLQDMKARELKQVDILKERISTELQHRGIDKLETNLFKLSFRKSTSVQFSGDANSLPDHLKTVKTQVSPDKTAIKTALKSGQEIQGAALVENKSLQIK